MNAEEVKKSEWYKSFLESSPSDAPDALKHASNPDNEYMLVYSDETGEWQYVIVPKNDQGFWMDGFKTKAEARALCTKMGWKIVSESA